MVTQHDPARLMHDRVGATGHVATHRCLGTGVHRYTGFKVDVDRYKMSGKDALALGHMDGR